MKPITFESYLSNRGIALKPWQQEAAGQFLRCLYPFREGPSGKTFLIDELAEFLDLHGNEFELTDRPRSLAVSGEVEEIQTTMSNADAVKVWLDLRKERDCFIMPRTPGSVEALEDVLYRNLTQRLVLESQESCVVAGGVDE